MTIAEAERFYEQDKRQYDPIKHKGFLIWFRQKIKQGYQPYLDIEGIENLIQKIVSWYEIKLPSRTLEKTEGIFDMRFPEQEELGKLMSVDQLRYRLTHYELESLDCCYRVGHGYSMPIGGYYNGDGILTDVQSWEHIISVTIKLDNETKWGLNKTRIRATDDGALKYFSCDAPEIGIAEDTKISTLRELLQNLKATNRKDIDYSVLEACITCNDNDVTLRAYILNMCALALLYSGNATPEHGLARAKSFIRDFNDYYGLTLSYENLEKLVSDSHSPEGFQKKKRKK